MKITPPLLGLLGAIVFSFFLIIQVDRRLNLINRFPDTMKFNYEKYGILGIIGVIIIVIIIINYWFRII
jgi:hypothetical protein